jgi:gliding motility-associated-like protein
MVVFLNNNPLPTFFPQWKEPIIVPCGTGKRVKYFILILFWFIAFNSYSQTGCTVPLPPVLTTVSVQPETGKTDLKWSLSPSSGIVAYIVYTYKAPDGLPIDTIWNPNATTYTVSSTGSKYFSISYVVTAYRLSGVPGENGCTSPFSNVLTTIYCSAEIDTCNNKISVKWNKYPDFPKPVKEYKILVSVNGGTLSEIYQADKSADSFIISDFLTDAQYCIAVKAIFDDGSFSTSNKSCLSTKMQKPPAWINADYATIRSGNKIDLSFTIDPSSEIKHFSLGKKIGSSGTFREISQPNSTAGKVLFSDNEADLSIINTYRLSAINSCNVPVMVSNPASNIVLNLEKSGKAILLSWNSYKKWQGEVLEYSLNINTGRGYFEKSVLDAADTVISLGYKEIMYDITGNEVCFFIKAVETNNPHGVTGESRSAEICTSPEEIITVPNLFTPDNDLLNDFFRPVLSFTPQDYHLIISDRKGKVLFESRDPDKKWDGSDNGSSQAHDVCLWFLKVTTPSGKVISKTGTITIVRNH